MREVARRSRDGGREIWVAVLSTSFAIAQQPPRQRGLGRYHPYTHGLVNAHYTGYSIMEIKFDKDLVPLSFLQYVLK